MKEPTPDLSAKYTLRVSARTYREQVRALSGNEKLRDDEHRRQWPDVYPLFDLFTSKAGYDTWFELPDVPSSMRGRVKGFCDSRNRLKPGHFVSMRESPSRDAGLSLMLQARQIIKGAEGRPTSLTSPRALIEALGDGDSIKIEGSHIGTVRNAMSNVRAHHKDRILIVVDSGPGYVIVRRVPPAEREGAVDPRGPAIDVAVHRPRAAGQYKLGAMKVGDEQVLERIDVNLETLRSLASRHNTNPKRTTRITVNASARTVIIYCTAKEV